MLIKNGRLKIVRCTMAVLLVALPIIGRVSPVAVASQPGEVAPEPNYVRRFLYVPNDPDLPDQWALDNTGQIIEGEPGIAGADIKIKKAWDIEKGDSNPVTVAVIDSGIDPTHPDLSGKLWHNKDEIQGNGEDDDDNGYVDDMIGYDFTAADSSESEPRDDLGHGTHVSGTSQAAPMVAGLAALILSRDPTAKPDRIRRLITLYADDLGAPDRDDYFGHGRVNAYRTLKNVSVTPDLADIKNDYAIVRRLR